MSAAEAERRLQAAGFSASEATQAVDAALAQRLAADAARPRRWAVALLLGGAGLSLLGAGLLAGALTGLVQPHQFDAWVTGIIALGSGLLLATRSRF
jgi:hypothetical protein